MRKGQAAMEYLMTYGWAILIVIVVVAALYAMGVFKIGGTAVPCSPCFGAQFAYIDYAAGTLKMRTGSREINLTACYADEPTACTSITTPDGDAIRQIISPGTTLTLSGFTPGTSYSLKITYLDTSSDLEHNETATLAA